MVRLESNGTVLDTYGDEPINLDINVQNNRDIGKVYAPISKTFTLPASDRNNQFFKHYYNVNVTDGFDAYTRTPCQLYVDSEQIFSGYLELLDTVTKDDQPKQYEVLVTSATPSLAKELEGKQLDELTLSSIPSVAYNETVIKNTWTGSVASGLLRFGLVGRKDLIDQQGILKAHYDGTTTAIEPFTVADFLPYVRMSEVFKAIIEENGFRYSSSWLDNDIDDVYLLLGRDGGVLPQLEAVNSTAFEVSDTSAVSFSGPVTDPVSNITEDNYTQLTFTVEDEDDDNVWNSANSRFTPKFTGIHKFEFDCIFSTGPFNNAEIAIFDTAELATCDPTFSNNCSTALGPVAINPTSNVFTNRFRIIEVFLEKNKEYEFWIRCETEGDSSSLTVRSLALIDAPFSLEGATITASQLLPDVTQKDFLGEIAKLYNLVFVPDQFDDKLLYIEPWKDWIASGSTFDITKYVDQTKDVPVRPTTEIQARSLSFAMAQGKSFYEDRHLEQFGYPAGSTLINDTGNEFAQGELKVESKFASPMILRDAISTIQWPQFTDENFEAVDYGLRLAYWNESRGYAHSFLYDGTVTDHPGGAVAALLPYDQYLPVPNSNYLGFAATAVADGINVPLNNFFTEYWSEYIGNIYDKDSRLISLEAKLDAHILNNIALNDQILYKNQFYLIQSIKYNTLTSRAQMELLKATRTSPVICDLTPSSYSFRGKVTFTDSSGASTTVATKNCCDFYGFTYSNGACYAKFDKPRTITAGNTIQTAPLFNSTGLTSNDVLGPVVPVYNNTARTYQLAPAKSVINDTYGSPVFDQLNAVLDATTTSPTVTYTTRQVNFQASGKLVNVNFVLSLTGISGGSGNIILDLSSVLPDEYVMYNDGASPQQPLGFAFWTTASGNNRPNLIPVRQADKALEFVYANSTAGGAYFVTGDLGSAGALWGSITYATE